MRPAGDLLTKMLADLYEVDLAAVVPPRTGLEIDLDAGILRAGGASRRFALADDVVHAALVAYLELVWAMRGTSREVVPLRRHDMHVLGEVLDLDEDAVVSALADLMQCSKSDARRLLVVLRRRPFLVPASAALVAGLALGVAVHAHQGGDSGPVAADRALPSLERAMTAQVADAAPQSAAAVLPEPVAVSAAVAGLGAESPGLSGDSGAVGPDTGPQGGSGSGAGGSSGSAPGGSSGQGSADAADPVDNGETPGKPPEAPAPPTADDSPDHPWRW
jgi:hypothetical protein